MTGRWLGFNEAVGTIQVKELKEQSRCSLYVRQPSQKISCKSVWKFLCKVDNRQNNDETKPHWRR